MNRKRPIPTWHVFSCLFLPRHGLRAAFQAGRPRIKCNNASSSGLARANPSFVNEGGGSRLRPRNAWWLLCQECAVVPIRGSQLCSRNNHHPELRNVLLFSSFFLFFHVFFSSFLLCFNGIRIWWIMHLTIRSQEK